jgi:hypothetical protein
MADAARELDLKPGSDLRALVTRLDKNFSPEDQHGFELMIGTQMLFYCFNTHAGNALARVATDERKDPPTVIADLIVAANARRVQLEKAPAQRKAAK